MSPPSPQTTAIAAGAGAEVTNPEKLASEATYREMVEALALQASMTCDGKMSPDAHAAAAIQAADALLARQEKRA